MKTLRLTGLAVSLILFAGVAFAEAPKPSSVIEAVAAIKAEADWRRRIEMTEDMAVLANKGAFPPFTDADIDAIGTLLSDEADGVRLRAVVALHYAGPRAARLLPALRKAYDEAKCEGGAVSAEGVLMDELRTLGDMVPEPDCPPGTGLAG